MPRVILTRAAAVNSFSGEQSFLTVAAALQKTGQQQMKINDLQEEEEGEKEEEEVVVIH